VNPFQSIGNDEANRTDVDDKDEDVVDVVESRSKEDLSATPLQGRSSGTKQTGDISDPDDDESEAEGDDRDNSAGGAPTPGKAFHTRRGRGNDTRGTTDSTEQDAKSGRLNTYPPDGQGNRTSSSTKANKQPLSSLFDVRPMLSGLWRYTRNAKLLSLILVVVCAFMIEGFRQITALAYLPTATGSDSSSLTKRAPGDELPIDIRYTQKWLAKMFGGTPDPILILTLLFTWMSMCILMAAIIYNMIIERTENRMTSSDKNTKDKWYNNKRLAVKKVWRWTKTCFLAAIRVLLMDRHPSIKKFWSTVGLWTCLRIALFVIQLLVAILMVRQVLAMASLVAGAETPIPSSLEIPYTLSALEDALPIMRPYPGGTMLLVVSVLTSVLIMLPAGWNSLLHPRKKNPNPSSRMQTLFRIITCQASGSGIGLGKYYAAVVGLLSLIVVVSFAACMVYFVEIMTFVGDAEFVKDTGYVDSIGLIGAFVIFGVFALPLGWIALKAEDTVRSMMRKRAGRKRSEPSVRRV